MKTAVVETAEGPVHFVAEEDGTAGGDRDATKEELWKQIFERAYEQEEGADPTMNTAGFVSTYTGEPVPDHELREITEATGRRVQALAPKRVLEVGCGTGMILFRVAPHVERFAALDFSTRALEYVGSQLGELHGRVELREGSALDLAAFPDGSFDLVIINGTVQYFPSIAYFVEVLRRAERVLAPGGHILLGDVRSQPHGALSYAAFECHRAADTATAKQVRALVAKAAAKDRELLLDPRVLHSLKRRLPRLRRTYHALHDASVVDEFTQFRFHLLLAFDGPEAGPPPPLTRRAVPNARLAVPRAAQAWLLAAPDDETIGSVRAAWKIAGELPDRLAKDAAIAMNMDDPTAFDVLETPAGWMPLGALSERDQWRPISDFARDPSRARAKLSFADAVKAELGVERVIVVDALPEDPEILRRLTAAT